MSTAESSACRLLSQLAGVGDAERLKVELHALQRRCGPQAVAQEITTCDFGDRNSKSALHRAALRGRAAILGILLEAGADPNALDDPGNTPLHYAAEMGHARAAHVLLRGGARAEKRNNFGTTPRQNAEAKSWESQRVIEGKAMVRRMIDEGTDAVEWEDLPAEEGPSSAPQPAAPDPESEGTCAADVQRASPELTLKEAAARMGWSQRRDSSATYSDVSTMATVQDLDLDTGCKLSTADLARRGDLAAVRVRLGEAFARGGKFAAIAEAADCEEGAQDSRIVFSALHVAASRGDVPMLRLLLATKADPNLVNDVGDTLLHMAASMGREEVVAELLRAGADPRIKNNFGKSPNEHAEPQPWDSLEMQRQKERTRGSFVAGGCGGGCPDAAATWHLAQDIIKL